MHDAVPTQSGYDLAALPATLLQMVEEILSNDESSSDDAELAQYLTEVGLSDTQARDALAYRICTA
ncbi:hypothetical protein [Lysobacter firmicutimachus]|uniref:Uncharacterized protein n=1 Tax=Lysobacter firmicutimachus TaxID=1792846 RepID=A0ABU8D958_9GAMM